MAAGETIGKSPTVTTDSIVIRKCHDLEELRTAVMLQKEVWNFTDAELVPLRLFVVAEKVGGQVLGAFDGPRMVGFALAVPGIRGEHSYLHSHMLAVLKDYRNGGLGRRIKLFQREEALGRRIGLIRWTFDPLELRNAHFNLNRLGVVCRKLLPNLYGVTTSPLHRGMATDRLVAEWRLDSSRVMASIAEGTDTERRESAGVAATILLPVEMEKWKAEGTSELLRLQDRIRGEFQAWFAKGFAAVATRRTEAGTEYLLAPWKELR